MARGAARTFTFEVDESSDLPLWVQLRNRLVYLIQSGFYQPGEQLPTVRALASDIRINYNTVNKAYLGLKTDGYIESNRGRGAFVRDLQTEVDEGYSSQIDTVLTDCIDDCRSMGMSLDDIGKCMHAKIMQTKRDEGLVNDEEGAGGRIITIVIGENKRTATGA